MWPSTILSRPSVNTPLEGVVMGMSSSGLTDTEELRGKELGRDVEVDEQYVSLLTSCLITTLLTLHMGLWA